MPTLQMIPTDKVAAGDANPRGKIDTAAAAFKELCASIEARGILQPILVSPPNGNKKHGVIAGYRRHAAATKLKLAEIPAMVIDLEGAELIAALMENIQREDLSPVAEAKAIKELQDRHGFTQVRAGEALGKSERWVRERLRILPLPEKTQKAYDAGDLPLESLVPVEKIAKQAPKAADALARVAGKRASVRAAVGGDRMVDALEEVIRESPKEELGCFVPVGNKHRRGKVDFKQVLEVATKAEQDKLKNRMAEATNAKKRLDRVDRYAYVGSYADTLFIEPADIDAANSFGCLLSIDGAHYITDGPWLVDRFLSNLDADTAKVEKAIAGKKAEKGGAKAAGGDDEAAKEERKRQREAEKQARDEARSNNLELGQRAHKALQAPAKISLEEEKLLALMVIGNHAEAIAARGLVYCYHDFQTEESLKNGGVRVTYAHGRDAAGDLVSAIKGAKKRGEAIGLALRALVLAHFADQSVVAPSKRTGFSLKYEADDAVVQLVEAVADQRELLPDAVREAQAEQRRIEEEETELWLLSTVKASRAKEGLSREELLDWDGVTAELLDGAVRGKQLKEHPEGEPSYTILAGGTKRLEKLKAAEKERQSA